jgi:hypothetical protein
MPAGDARGAGQSLPKQNKSLGLPYRPFLFTVDQIAVLLDISERRILAEYLYFEGRSIGTRHKHLMIARNIAPPDKKPEWRIAERELMRWMRHKGFRYYERGVTSN